MKQKVIDRTCFSGGKRSGGGGPGRQNKKPHGMTKNTLMNYWRRETPLHFTTGNPGKIRASKFSQKAKTTKNWWNNQQYGLVRFNFLKHKSFIPAQTKAEYFLMRNCFLINSSSVHLKGQIVKLHYSFNEYVRPLFVLPFKEFGTNVSTLLLC